MFPRTRGLKFESRARQTGRGVVNGLTPFRLIFKKPGIAPKQWRRNLRLAHPFHGLPKSLKVCTVHKNLTFNLID